MNDRRTNERIQRELSVLCRQMGEGISYPLKSFDISEDGLSFQSPYIFQPDTKLRIEITATLPAQVLLDNNIEQLQISGPPRDQAAFVTAIVRSCRLEGANWIIGVEFEGPDSDLASSLLREYVAYDKEFPDEL